MNREHDIAQAPHGPSAATTEEGAPKGAPNTSVPAGEPEAPVGPASSTPSTDQGAPTPEHGARTPKLGDNTPSADRGPSSPNAQNAANPETDHERELEHDLEELAAKAGKADEYLELAQRTRADFENYRKRAAREAAAAQERGVAKLARELLPAVDNLDRALDAAKAAGPADGAHAGDNGTDTLVSGIKLVHAEVIAALARAGIERFSPEGERFDPQQHEAVAQQPVQGAEPGTVVEVYQRGYRLGEVVIRPARVVVAA